MVWETDDVVRRALLAATKTDGPVPIATLETLINDFRRLIDDVYDLELEFRAKPPHMVDLRMTEQPG